MKKLCVVAVVAFCSFHTQATITLNVGAADLRTFGGSDLMPTTGQVLLVATTTDAIFGGPTADSFVSGDDVILFRWDLNSGAGDGFFNNTTGDFSLGSFAGLTPGDLVQLYWFPTLTSGSTVPGEGTTFGFHRPEPALDGSDPWVIPADGSTVGVFFLTQSQGFSTPDSAGWANFTVAPIPEASNVITAVLALGLCAFRATRGFRQKS